MGGAPIAALDTLPPQAWTGPGTPVVMPERGAAPHALGPGLPYAPGAWKPPGIAGPWPKSAYICDGGDYVLPAQVDEHFNVSGVEQSDTIAHYDTLDGRRIVEPSNRVCIYAPRFGAVRRIANPLVNESQDQLARFNAPTTIARSEETQIATTALQPIQPVGQRGTKAAGVQRERQRGGEVETRQRLAAVHDGFQPYENFQVIRIGSYDGAEKARLAKHIDAAITWASDQAAQVILDGKLANELVGDRQAEQLFIIEEPNSPKLRIIKVASSSSAKPGETIAFTLRFDNVGDVPIGNVTIIDNLATRLEYVPDSQQASLEGEFVLVPNQGGSQALRWEIKAPLEPGEGGVIRFKALVR
jgi:uncharacterized repeat protein (TIGR01451 family)